MKQETILDLIMNPTPVKGERKFFVDRWGTVYSKNPNLPHKEAPKREHSFGEEDRKK